MSSKVLPTAQSAKMICLAEMVLCHVPLLLEPFLLLIKKLRRLFVVKRTNEVLIAGLLGISHYTISVLFLYSIVPYFIDFLFVCQRLLPRSLCTHDSHEHNYIFVFHGSFFHREYRYSRHVLMCAH